MFMMTLPLMLGNGSGTDFQASQCFSMDVAAAAAATADAATAAAARCVHSLKKIKGVAQCKSLVRC